MASLPTAGAAGRDGRWYPLRIRPYKEVDNRLDGAVVTARYRRCETRKARVVNPRSFELEDARRWILLAMEIVDAQNR